MTMESKPVGGAETILNYDEYDRGWHDGYDDILPEYENYDNEDYMAGYDQGSLDC